MWPILKSRPRRDISEYVKNLLADENPNILVANL